MPARKQHPDVSGRRVGEAVHLVVAPGVVELQEGP